jgi:hypothetical protein
MLDNSKQTTMPNKHEKQQTTPINRQWQTLAGRDITCPNISTFSRPIQIKRKQNSKIKPQPTATKPATSRNILTFF